MEESPDRSKVKPKRKRVSTTDKIGKKRKRSSRRDKKSVKNIEKKTRSGCTYSPYEMYCGKPSRIQCSMVDKEQQTENSTRNAPNNSQVKDSIKDVKHNTMEKDDLKATEKKAFKNIQTQTTKEFSAKTSLISATETFINKNKENKEGPKSDRLHKTMKIDAVKKRISGESHKNKIGSTLQNLSIFTKSNICPETLKEVTAEETIWRIKKLIASKELKKYDGLKDHGILWSQKLKCLPKSQQGLVIKMINNIFLNAFGQHSSLQWRNDTTLSKW